MKCGSKQTQLQEELCPTRTLEVGQVCVFAHSLALARAAVGKKVRSTHGTSSSSSIGSASAWIDSIAVV